MSTVRRRLVPYFLLGPGIIWLILFFVVPMYFMARLSLDSGTLETGFRFNWQFSNYSDALSLTTPSSCAPSTTRAPRRSSACFSATRSRMRSPSRRAAGGTPCSSR